MRYYYSPSLRIPKRGFPKDDLAFVLSADKWDDYGYNTQFQAYLLRRGALEFLGSVRLYFEGHASSRRALKRLVLDGNEMFFEFHPKRFDFISLGTDLDYYKRLVRLLESRKKAERVLVDLNDVAILTELGRSSRIKALASHPAYETSLLRGHAERQALALAPSVVLNTRRPPANAEFTLRMKLKGFPSEHSIQFDFREALLPGRINVLIGRNGCGKTQTLLHLIGHLLRQKHYNHIPIATSEDAISPEPVFRKLVALSLSPYSAFPLPQEISSQKVLTSYACISFKGVRGGLSISQLKRKRLDWLREIIHVDSYESVAEWKRIPRLLALASSLGIDGFAIHYDAEDGKRRKFTIKADVSDDMAATYQRRLSPKRKPSIAFLKGKDEAPLSSGQEQLLLMTLGLLAEIERESLVLIDEPELYLHPDAEIAFIGLLLDFLERFESFGVIATHSNTIVRELPNTAVRIFGTDDSGVPFVRAAPFQTFGADVTDIANKVFEGVYAKHPFREWLVNRFGDLDFEQIRQLYGDVLNLENLALLYGYIENRDR